MKIGGNIRNQIKSFVAELAQLSGETAGKRVPVDDINKRLGLTRTEVKEILEYVETCGYVVPETIGGKWLYGHVSITEKGLEKLATWEKKTR